MTDLFAVSRLGTRVSYYISPSPGGQFFVDVKNERGILITSRILPTYGHSLNFVRWLNSLGVAEMQEGWE